MALTIMSRALDFDSAFGAEPARQAGGQNRANDAGFSSK